MYKFFLFIALTVSLVGAPCAGFSAAKGNDDAEYDAAVAECDEMGRGWEVEKYMGKWKCRQTKESKKAAKENQKAIDEEVEKNNATLDCKNKGDGWKVEKYMGKWQCRQTKESKKAEKEANKAAKEKKKAEDEAKDKKDAEQECQIHGAGWEVKEKNGNWVCVMTDEKEEEFDKSAAERECKDKGAGYEVRKYLGKWKCKKKKSSGDDSDDEDSETESPATKSLFDDLKIMDSALIKRLQDLKS